MVAPWGPRPTKLLRFPFPRRTLVAGPNSVKAFWDLILSLFVVLVALLLASSCSMFFEVVFYPLLGPLWVDFGSPRWPSEPQKPWFRFRHSLIFERSTFYLSRWSWERFGGLLVSFLVLLGVSWATFGGSWGSLGRPSGASDRAQTGDTHWVDESLSSWCLLLTSCCHYACLVLRV